MLSQSVEVEGLLDAILKSVLPHVITHTVLAHHFGPPVRRAGRRGRGGPFGRRDHRQRYEALACKILAEKDRAIPLKRLFALTQYPRDVMAFYAGAFRSPVSW